VNDATAETITMTLTLDLAEKVVRAGREHASTLGVAACLVVCDAAGHLKAFARMDRAWLGAIDVALRKAKTSVLFEAETQLIWEVSRPDAQAHGLESSNGGLITFAGGIPLRTAVGELLGAVGVSGGQVAQDYAVAQAAIKALGLP
jgi:uncharacterized protein GlcG (DUF336 family)